MTRDSLCCRAGVTGPGNRYRREHLILGQGLQVTPRGANGILRVPVWLEAIPHHPGSRAPTTYPYARGQQRGIRGGGGGGGDVNGGGGGEGDGR